MLKNLSRTLSRFYFQRLYERNIDNVFSILFKNRFFKSDGEHECMIETGLSSERSEKLENQESFEERRIDHLKI